MRKLRTRQHIIEDLGLNHVERQVLKTGYVIQRSVVDYGLDGEILTFNEMGEIEFAYFKFQLKSTDVIKSNTKEGVIKFDLSQRDIESWLLAPTIVLLLVYDAQLEIAYYLDLQSYFQENRTQLKNIRKYIRVNIPINHIFTPEAMRDLRKKLNL
jgi:Domain of unknown function (DUF4365)